MANKNLGELIEWLKKQPKSKIVNNGFSSPHTDRGSYEELAFHPEEESKISDMLKHAKSAINKYFPGWKGGSFKKMNKYTDVLIGEYGHCGENITETHFKYWGKGSGQNCSVEGIPTEKQSAQCDMIKYMLWFELRYTDVINNEVRYPTKRITISVLDTLDEAISKGNEIINKLNNVFEIRFDDKFSKYNDLVTNCCYPTNGVSYFFKIEKLKFDDMYEAIDIAMGAKDRVIKLRSEMTCDD